MNASWTNDRLNVLKLEALDGLVNAAMKCGVIWYVTDTQFDSPALVTESGMLAYNALVETMPAFIESFTKNALIAASYEYKIPFDRLERKKWFRNGLSCMASCSAVLLDPDTGLNYGQRPKNSPEFVDIGEVLLAANNHCLLIYQHCSRREDKVLKQATAIRSFLQTEINPRRIKIKRRNRDKAFLILIEGLKENWPADYLSHWVEL